MTDLSIPKKEFEAETGWNVEDDGNGKVDKGDRFIPPKSIDPQQTPRAWNDKDVQEARGKFVQKEMLDPTAAKLGSMQDLFDPPADLSAAGKNPSGPPTKKPGKKEYVEKFK